VAQEFLQRLKEAVIAFYGDDPQQSPDYGRIVNAHHFDRLTKILDSGDIYHGGQHDRDDLFIAPTILVNVGRESPIMREEVFGPILPVLEIGSVEEAIEAVNARPSPLGLYVFSGDPQIAERILAATASGDAAVNDCTVQPLIRELPFGGVGNSGMGKYHGEWGFREYTNARGVLYRGATPDPDVRYPPYSEHARLRRLLIRLTF
jgi:aldehyde dehydrogenase (NAD+)